MAGKIGRSVHFYFHRGLFEKFMSSKSASQSRCGVEKHRFGAAPQAHIPHSLLTDDANENENSSYYRHGNTTCEMRHPRPLRSCAPGLSAGGPLARCAHPVSALSQRGALSADRRPQHQHAAARRRPRTPPPSPVSVPPSSLMLSQLTRRPCTRRRRRHCRPRRSSLPCPAQPGQGGEHR